jgi:hypothetical protein
MNWTQLLGPAAIAVGAYVAAEAAGKSRGSRSAIFKKVGVALALLAGLSMLVALIQFGWVTSPPGWLAAAAASWLLVQGVVAARDLSDGQPDRGCRIAMLVLPLLLVMGGAWLVNTVPDIAQRGGTEVTSRVK